MITRYTIVAFLFSLVGFILMGYGVFSFLIGIMTIPLFNDDLPALIGIYSIAYGAAIFMAVLHDRRNAKQIEKS